MPALVSMATNIPMTYSPETGHLATIIKDQDYPGKYGDQVGNATDQDKYAEYQPADDAEFPPPMSEIRTKYWSLWA